MVAALNRHRAMPSWATARTSGTLSQAIHVPVVSVNLSMALTVLMRPGDGCCMRSPRNETGADHRPRWTDLLFLLGLARRLRDARLATRAFGPVVVRRERVR